MSLTKLEQETIVLFNEGEPTADIQTYNGALKRKLLTLCESHPEQARHIHTDEYGGMRFTVPKKWIRINAGKSLSKEQRMKLAQRAREQFCT